MNFGKGNGEEKSDGIFFCKILINLPFCCCTYSVVWARNHDYGNDADVRLFDREKSSDYSEDLPDQPDATNGSGEDTDRRFVNCHQCPFCCVGLLGK